MHFEIIGKIENPKTIAVDKSIRDIERLEEQFGKGRWRKLKGTATVPDRSRFVLCITNSEPDLEMRKIYEIMKDASAEKDGYVRLVDESSEDYLYPGSHFVAIELPSMAEHAFAEPSLKDD